MNPATAQLLDKLRRKLHYLHGYADAYSDDRLRDWLVEVRQMLNDYEKSEAKAESEVTS